MKDAVFFFEKQFTNLNTHFQIFIQFMASFINAKK